MTKTVTAYVSKYALSVGVIEAQVADQGNGHCVRRGKAWDIYRWGQDAFHTREEAVTDANKRRDDRLANLRKQISMIEGKVFS